MDFALEEVVPTAQQFDVVIIGGGPAGYAAALRGGLAGLNIAVVEKEKVGGTCLHRGCIPAKEFLETATVYRTVTGAKEFGIAVDSPSIEFAQSQARKQKVVDQLWRGLQGLMKKRKITTFIGTGTLGPDHLVRVDDGTELVGNHVILASGSVPRSIPGLRGRRRPGPDLRRGARPRAAAGLRGGDRRRRHRLRVRLHARRSGHPGDGPGGPTQDPARLRQGRGRRGAALLQEAGHRGPHRRHRDRPHAERRRPLHDGPLRRWRETSPSRRWWYRSGAGPCPTTWAWTAPRCSVDQRGFVEVDEYMQTGEPGVFAAGDLVDTPALAHVGFAEAVVIIDQILGDPVVPVDYAKVPWCIYCHPEVAFAGLSEEAAREAGFDVVTKKDPYGGNGRALIVGEPEGLVKVICEKDADGKAGRVLGVHMVGPWVTEQLGQAYLSVNWEATPSEVAHFIQPHPTLSETFGETMLALTGRGLHVG